MLDKTLKNAYILIVDDQSANIDVLEDFLEMEGYTRLNSTTDPRNVLSLTLEFKPDLILLDLSMPHLSGFEVMEQLKTNIDQTFFIPILVLTADVTKEAKIRALASGASDFLTKPFDLIEVGLRIKNLLYANFLHQQLLQQNQLLEDKVKERTRDLQIQNEKLIIARDKAEASDRLKTAFINNISHEIRTPLNGILGFSQFLADPNLSADEKKEYMSIIEMSSDRLVHTVTNFMDISLLSSANVEVSRKSIDFDAIVEEIVKKYKPICHHKGLKINVKKQHKGGVGEIYSDRDMLSKILKHLVDNAYKFTAEGEVEVVYGIKNKKLEFSVQDTGVGISSGAKKEMFKYFMQEDVSDTRGYEGNGLGLAIVKGYVDLLGGTIRFNSKKGEGSIFFISLPLVYAPEKEKTAVQQNVTGSSYQIVLVAEDDDINYSYLEILLSFKNLKVLRALNGKDALKIYKENPEISMVLMDLKMPEMDGFESTKQLKKMNKDLPVIAVTAYSNPYEREQARKAGCDDFISKPLKRDLLIAKLKKYGLILK